MVLILFFDLIYRFQFARGGFQGGEGFSAAAEWFIENVREELDSPLEYFFDEEQQQLLFVPNGTSDTSRLQDMEFVTTNLKVLFDIQGTESNPVQDISISGLVFKDAVHTYLDPHGTPSGGDWALQYSAAIRANHTNNLTIANSLFTRLDGLGIGLYGRNYNTSVDSNEFEWLGGSAIVLWGRTASWLNANKSQTLPWSDHPNGKTHTPRDVVSVFHTLTGVSLFSSVHFFSHHRSRWHIT